MMARLAAVAIAIVPAGAAVLQGILPWWAIAAMYLLLLAATLRIIDHLHQVFDGRHLKELRRDEPYH